MKGSSYSKAELRGGKKPWVPGEGLARGSSCNLKEIRCSGLGGQLCKRGRWRSGGGGPRGARGHRRGLSGIKGGGPAALTDVCPGPQSRLLGRAVAQQRLVPGGPWQGGAGGGLRFSTRLRCRLPARGPRCLPPCSPCIRRCLPYSAACRVPPRRRCRPLCCAHRECPPSPHPAPFCPHRLLIPVPVQRAVGLMAGAAPFPALTAR